MIQESDLEDGLDTGAVSGGGAGPTYSYADFALTNVPKAIQVIRKALQAGNQHRRSWILFFDPEYASEWVGAWPDSPPPPQKGGST